MVDVMYVSSRTVAASTFILLECSLHYVRNMEQTTEEKETTYRGTASPAAPQGSGLVSKAVLDAPASVLPSGNCSHKNDHDRTNKTASLSPTQMANP